MTTQQQQQPLAPLAVVKLQLLWVVLDPTVVPTEMRKRAKAELGHKKGHTVSFWKEAVVLKVSGKFRGVVVDGVKEKLASIGMRVVGPMLHGAAQHEVVSPAAASCLRQTWDAGQIIWHRNGETMPGCPHFPNCRVRGEMCPVKQLCSRVVFRGSGKCITTESWSSVSGVGDLLRSRGAIAQARIRAPMCGPAPWSLSDDIPLPLAAAESYSAAAAAADDATASPLQKRRKRSPSTVSITSPSPFPLPFPDLWHASSPPFNRMSSEASLGLSSIGTADTFDLEDFRNASITSLLDPPSTPRQDGLGAVGAADASDLFGAGGADFENGALLNSTSESPQRFWWPQTQTQPVVAQTQPVVAQTQPVVAQTQPVVAQTQPVVALSDSENRLVSEVVRVLSVQPAFASSLICHKNRDDILRLLRIQNDDRADVELSDPRLYNAALDIYEFGREKSVGLLLGTILGASVMGGRKKQARKELLWRLICSRDTSPAVGDETDWIMDAIRRVAARAETLAPQHYGPIATALSGTTKLRGWVTDSIAASATISPLYRLALILLQAFQAQSPTGYWNLFTPVCKFLLVKASTVRKCSVALREAAEAAVAAEAAEAAEAAVAV